MKIDDLMSRVQERTRLDTRGEAIAITRAVLETLGERLDRKVRNGVAAQLPDEWKDFLFARGDNTERYDLTEFYKRVGARADMSYQDASAHTRQVLSVLRQAISEGEVQDIREDLPAEYEQLFEKELPDR